MKNFLQPGNTMTTVAPAGGVTSGDPVLVGARLGVAAHDAAAGAVLEVAMEGVFSLPKDTNLVITQGDRLFWDAANGWLDKTVAAQVAVGVAWSSALLADATVEVKLGASTPAGT